MKPIWIDGIRFDHRLAAMDQLDIAMSNSNKVLLFDNLIAARTSEYKGHEIDYEDPMIEMGKEHQRRFIHKSTFGDGPLLRHPVVHGIGAWKL